MFVLDRDTRKSVWPAEERAVPQGGVEGDLHDSQRTGQLCRDETEKVRLEFLDRKRCSDRAFLEHV